MTDSPNKESEHPDGEKQNSQLENFLQQNPLDSISATSLALGILLGFSLSLALNLQAYLPTFPTIYVYLASLAVFHFLEFYITARYNTPNVSQQSFLLNNGSEYTIAHISALAEALLENWLFPGMKSCMKYIRLTGLLLMVIGQAVRSLAMAQAGVSFSHIIAEEKKGNHHLVTTGLYRWFRHPSYFGFFYWAVGTQLFLLNPVCLLGFLYVLWMFFARRIAYEEKRLIAFFGREYMVYKQRTKTWIPFIE